MPELTRPGLHALGLGIAEIPGVRLQPCWSCQLLGLPGECPKLAGVTGHFYFNRLTLA